MHSSKVKDGRPTFLKNQSINVQVQNGDAGFHKVISKLHWDVASPVHGTFYYKIIPKRILIGSMKQF